METALSSYDILTVIKLMTSEREQFGDYTVVLTDEELIYQHEFKLFGRMFLERVSYLIGDSVYLIEILINDQMFMYCTYDMNNNILHKTFMFSGVVSTQIQYDYYDLYPRNLRTILTKLNGETDNNMMIISKYLTDKYQLKHEELLCHLDYSSNTYYVYDMRNGYLADMGFFNQDVWISRYENEKMSMKCYLAAISRLQGNKYKKPKEDVDSPSKWYD
jgi:hypothetical protein